MREKICKAAYESDKFQNITYCNLSWYLLQSLGLYQTSPTMAFPIHHPCYLKSDCGLASWLHLTSYRFPNPPLSSYFPCRYGWSQLILLTSFPPLLIRLNFMVNIQPQSPLLICSPLSHQKSRQHCRLTICIELVELANSIRWQDSNNNTDTETRCLVYRKASFSHHGQQPTCWCG